MDRWGYVMNLDGYSNIRTHSIALYSLNNNVAYFVRSGVGHILKEIKKFIGEKT